MKFTVRTGSDPVARLDGTLLKAIGLPSGGVVSVGSTHVLTAPGMPGDPLGFELGPISRRNAGVEIGDTVDVRRAVLGPAAEVVAVADDDTADPRAIVDALQGRPVTVGDRLEVKTAGRQEPVGMEVAAVDPAPAAVMGPGTRLRFDDGVETRTDDGSPIPTTADALLAGLDSELDLLAGWLALLTSPEDLPTTWGLPSVAGVILEAPPGCGTPELVRAAADAAGAKVEEVDLDLVFKPRRLLDVLEAAVHRVEAPAVVFVDRVEAFAGQEGFAPFRTQVAAVLRWFLDAIAERPGVACVLGVASRSHLDDSVAASPLLPRSLTVPPPDLVRRRLLFEAALARIPSEDLDHELFAARSAGFSGTDVLSAVVHASSVVARSRRPLSNEDVLDGIEGTVPSLGSTPMGEVPSYGFDRVADLVEVKRRLTEAVIWPISDPDRFRTLGIEPPRGILLFGPPGTGKTFVVRALAHEAGAAFFSVKGAELLDKWVGESERAVRDVFSRARAAEPSVIFFDELDALAPVRGRSVTSVTDSVVAAMLTELDGVTSRGSVAVVGASNRRDLIDPALLRAGRFEVHIEMGLPEAEGRRALLDITDVPFAEDLDLDALADATEGMSFADLTGMLREAALEALRSDLDAREVRMEHAEAAVARWRSGRLDVPD